MAITLTGNKYTGTLSSTGTNTLTDTGASFVSGDFNTPRMAWLFRSGSAVGLARVNSYISGTVLALDQPFFDYEGDEVTQVSGDTYYISQTATEVATTGWAVSGEVITVTDKVNFGTAGSKTSLFLHIEDYNIIASWAYTNTGPSAFEHNGGCTTFGNPLSLKKRITSSPCRIQSTVGVDGQLTDCGDVAATLMHFGTSFSGAGSVVRIGGGNHLAATPGFWQVYCNCVSDSCDFVSPDAKAWTSRASFQRVYNLTSSGAGLYFINLRWADGYVEGGAFRGSGLALSVTGSDNAGTYNFGAPAEQRLTVIDHIKAIWRTGTADTQTMNATNVLIKDSIKQIIPLTEIQKAIDLGVKTGIEYAALSIEREFATLNNKVFNLEKEVLKLKHPEQAKPQFNVCSKANCFVHEGETCASGCMNPLKCIFYEETLPDLFDEVESVGVDVEEGLTLGEARQEMEVKPKNNDPVMVGMLVTETGRSVTNAIDAQTVDLKGTSDRDLTEVFDNTPSVNLGTMPADVLAIKSKTDSLNFTGDDVQSIASNMRGTDGANTVTPDNSGIAAIESAVDNLNDFNPATDTVANVALVDTVTTNTDQRGTDGANTVSPDNASIAAILADTDDLQSNQGNFATATGFSTPADISNSQSAVIAQVDANEVKIDSIASDMPTAEQIALEILDNQEAP